MRARILRILVVGAVLVLAAYLSRGRIQRLFLRPQAPSAAQAGNRLRDVPAQGLVTVATDLVAPWEIEFLPDGALLVSERPGRLTVIRGETRSSFEVDGVRQVGEGGLLGIALHPRFRENAWLYVYYTGFGASGFVNRVVRYQFSPASGIKDPRVILDGIPAATFHDGGRIVFGPDGFLYIATGDATDGSLAQEPQSLGGKILRVTDQGQAAPGNPFETLVYSMGHRNPQGLTWDTLGQLWSTEHGRSGVESGFDELNLVRAGGNYGWPIYMGDAVRAGVVPPAAHSGPDYTWAPAGAASWNDRIFFGGLRGEALYEARIHQDARADVRVHFHAELGRIRVVRIGPDGMLYLATSNRDTRGAPRRGDDRIVRMDPAFFSR